MIELQPTQNEENAITQRQQVYIEILDDYEKKHIRRILQIMLLILIFSVSIFGMVMCIEKIKNNP